jgi:hypothetical protein
MKTELNIDLNLNYELLKRQRDELLEAIWEDKGTELWGLVELLDALVEELEKALNTNAVAL